LTDKHIFFVLRDGDAGEENRREEGEQRCSD
jgi:hypothetical protein